MTNQSSDGGIPRPEGHAAVIDTDYKVGRDNVRAKLGPLGLDFHNPVFLISGVVVVVFVLLTLLFPSRAGEMLPALRAWLTSEFTWFFLGAGNIFVLFSLMLIVSPWGGVRLGGADAKPDYSYAGWLAMLFAAGMGIGLMFYGVSEPMSHLGSSFGGVAVDDSGARTDWAPLGAAAGDQQAAISLSMAATIYHWGLHPWAMYAVVALALALFTYNKGLPLTIRSAFYPIFGERVWGWVGHVIDTLAVFATVFGLATSLGLGAKQANAGLNELFGLTISTMSQVVLIVLITAIALVSVVRGLEGGVKVLSEVNMGFAVLLMLFVFLAGPTVAIVGLFGDAIAAYVVNLPALSMPFGRDDANFSQGWTAFYWAWWVSWSPFVGMFIARVSRGRTVREFIACVLLIPTGVCILWMSVFGGTAITQFVQDGYTAVNDAELPLQLFAMLKALPLTQIASFVGILLVVVFFVTSSDSGSLVIDTITAGGKIDAPMPQRVFWCLLEGAIAIALLIGGGLTALQAAVISTGLPFTLVLLLMCWAIVRGLMSETR